MEHSIDFGNTNIRFKVNRRKRKTLGINVLPSGEVTVDAPEEADVSKIKELVNKRAAWILKQKREVASYPPQMPPKLYVTGETFKYLGIQYRLKVIESDHNAIGINNDRLVVYTSHGSDPEIIKIALIKWFRDEALKVFKERLDSCMPLVEKIGVLSRPTIKIRKMEKRWGSCTNDGLILLNPELVAAPIDCIDYVIIHELCHLKEHSHNQRFYNLLSKILPDYTKSKKKLDRLL